MSLKREAVAQPLPTIYNLYEYLKMDGSKSFCKFGFTLGGFLRFTNPFKNILVI
jgi:hypothetical protein